MVSSDAQPGILPVCCSRRLSYSLFAVSLAFLGVGMCDGLHKSLPQVLEAHWLAYLRETGTSEATFAAGLRAHFEATVPEYARSVDWSPHPDAFMRMQRDAQKVKRWFDPDVTARFPLEALESFIAAFPVERRWTLQAEILGRQGLLAVPMPAFSGTADAANLGRMGKETGEAIMAAAALLDDGVIDERDAARAEETVRQIDEGIAVMLEMRKRIEQQALRPSSVVLQMQDRRR